MFIILDLLPRNRLIYHVPVQFAHALIPSSLGKDLMHPSPQSVLHWDHQMIYKICCSVEEYNCKFAGI